MQQDKGLTQEEALKQAQAGAMDQTNNRGNISFTNEGKAIITAFRSADTSTMAHEALGHTYIERRMRESSKGNKVAKEVLDSLISEYNAANKTSITLEDLNKENEAYNEAVAKGEKIDTPIYTGLHEKFAEGFEQWLQEGQKSKNSKLQQVYDNFKNWLLELYGTLSDSVKLSKGMNDLYEQMLGQKPSKKAVDELLKQTEDVSKETKAETTQAEVLSESQLKEVKPEKQGGQNAAKKGKGSENDQQQHKGAVQGQQVS